MKLAFWRKEEPVEDIGMPSADEIPGISDRMSATDRMLESTAPGTGEQTGLGEPSFPMPYGRERIEARMISPGSPEPEPSFAERSRLQPTTLETKPGYVIEKELELIAAKLDVLKAGIDNINQRLETLEKGKEQRVVRW